MSNSLSPPSSRGRGGGVQFRSSLYSEETEAQGGIKSFAQDYLAGKWMLGQNRASQTPSFKPHLA